MYDYDKTVLFTKNALVELQKRFEELNRWENEISQLKQISQDIEQMKTEFGQLQSNIDTAKSELIRINNEIETKQLEVKDLDDQISAKRSEIVS